MYIYLGTTLKRKDYNTPVTKNKHRSRTQSHTLIDVYIIYKKVWIKIFLPTVWRVAI